MLRSSGCHGEAGRPVRVFYLQASGRAGAMAEYRKLVKFLDDPGTAHFFTCSCLHRRPFLRSKRACQYLVEAIDSARSKLAFHVWAYVFMPEHVHLLLWLPDGATSISDATRSIKQSVALRIVQYCKKNNPEGLSALRTGKQRPMHSFWQAGPGYDRNIYSAMELEEKFNYIHNNPVNRGLVSFPDDWPWSSAAAWAGKPDVPLRIDSDSMPLILKR